MLDKSLLFMIFPVNFFYLFLYYTDVSSAVFVLLFKFLVNILNRFKYRLKMNLLIY